MASEKQEELNMSGGKSWFAEARKGPSLSFKTHENEQKRKEESVFHSNNAACNKVLVVGRNLLL